MSRWSATQGQARPRWSRRCSRITGAIQRAGRVEDGTTVSDFDEVEVRQQRSVNLTLAPVLHAGIKVNLLDTPGYADFTGDLRAGLRAADAALFTVPATDGVDGLTQMLWEECAGSACRAPWSSPSWTTSGPTSTRRCAPARTRSAMSVPRCTCRSPTARARSGPDRPAVRQVLRLLGRHRTERDPDPAYADRAEELRGALIEGIIQETEDETLMDRYLSGEDIDPKVLIEDLEKAVARGSFYPVLAASSFEGGVGFAELLEVMTQAFPAPSEHPMPGVTTLDGKNVAGLSCDPEGPLLAEVIKTASDPYVGRISLVRVFSGTLRPDATVHVSGHGMAERGHADHDSDERIGALTSPLGKQQRPVAAVRGRATSARWPSCPPRRPATRCRTRTSRC